MNDKIEENINNNFSSSEKTNSFPANDESKFDQNTSKIRRISTVQTNSISHKASFQSKLMFFNSRAIQEELNKNKNYKKAKEVINIKKKDECNKKNINDNINKNKILESKNNTNNSNQANINNNNGDAKDKNIIFL